MTTPAMPDTMREEMAALTRALGPGVAFPPPCFVTMKGGFTQYESRSSLTVTFPVEETILNPLGVMQGGFISAAIDNVMGPLSYLAMRAPAATLDLHTQFIRGAALGDILTVTARVVSRTPRTLVMTAEARNQKGKLIAMATANAAVIAAT
jgi:uncharacterized protein (TIGR00369 family)